MNNQEQKANMVVKYNIGEIEIKLTPKIVQEYIVGNDTQITDQEYKFFTELCKARKLNPFLKEAYCVKYGSQPAQLVVSKDVFLKRAILNKYYDGKESGIIVQDDKGNITERKGCFYTQNETIVGGWAKVYRKNWSIPEYKSVAFSEVSKTKSNGELNTNWKNQGATMVEKVAVVRALKEAFVDDFAGLTIDGDIPEEEALISDYKADIVIEAEPEKVQEEAPPKSLDDL